jgi:endonuclease YncB( thermonuclease family)
MTTREYIYPVVEVVKVTDGDTFWLRLDVGFRGLLLIDCRLDGFDCPEVSRGTDFEKQQGGQATKVTAGFLTSAPGALWVRTEKDPDDFGRWLGEVWRETDDGTMTYLGDVLRDQGLASIWPTRWHDEFDSTA